MQQELLLADQVLTALDFIGQTIKKKRNSFKRISNYFSNLQMMFKSCLHAVLIVITVGGCTDRPTAIDASKVRTTLIDSLIVQKINSIDKSAFIGKPVGLFLSDTIFKNYEEIYFIDEPPGVLDRVELEFPKGFKIKIRVKEYKYVQQFSPTLSWSLDEFKKEKMRSIELIPPTVE